MKIVEIYKTIQGEGSHTGELTTFIRTAGCNMRCIWCDTPYSWNKEGLKDAIEMTIEEIVKEVERNGVKHVCITGGEPLLQKELNELISALKTFDCHIEIFTNGTIPLNTIYGVDKWVVDYKLKSAKDKTPFHENNLYVLRRWDELKFVVADDDDFNEMLEIIGKYKFNAKVLISPCLDGKVNSFARKIAERIIKENLNVRYSLQVHTVLWGRKKGV